MSGYEELERRLRESVRELGAEREAETVGVVAPRHGLWRLRGRRRGLLVMLVALVVGGGVATAAQTGVLSIKQDHPLSAREVARNVMLETQDAQACRKIAEGRGATTELAALSATVGPLLTSPPDAAAERAVLRYNHGGPVVVNSARRIAFGDRAEVLLWVAVGNGFGSLADPAACGAARLAQLAHELPDPGSRLRQKAAAVLRGYRDTIPELQTLWILRRHSGRASGAGIPLDGRSLPVGVVTGGGGDYTGIAVPGAIRVTLDGRRLHRSYAVKDRVFALTLPAHTGPVKLRQRAADGRVVATQTLRR
jgi:hypothetical protein